jgi:hypothetical protein
MKIFFYIVLVTLYSSVSFSSSVQQDQEIEIFVNELTEAMNSHDIDSVMLKWSSNGEMITLAGGIVKGHNSLKQLFAESFAKYLFLTQYVRFNGVSEVTVDGVWKTSQSGPPNYPDCGIFLYQLIKVNNKWEIKIAYSSVPREGIRLNTG